MDFLNKEFEGLPNEFIRISLKELEKAIRASVLYGNDDTANALHSQKICARISNIIAFAQAYRKDLSLKSTVTDE